MQYTKRTSYHGMARSGGTRANSGTATAFSGSGYVYRGSQPTTEDDILKARRIQDGLKGTTLTEEEIQERIREFRNVLQYRPNAVTNISERCNRRGISVRGLSLVERFEAVIRYDNEKGKIRASYSA